jgi:hypothetical protein
MYTLLTKAQPHFEVFLELFYAPEVLRWLPKLIESLRLCLTDATKETRQITYRILELLIKDDIGLSPLFDIHIDIFLIRTLVRDSRF